MSSCPAAVEQEDELIFECCLCEYSSPSESSVRHHMNYKHQLVRLNQRSISNLDAVFFGNFRRLYKCQPCGCWERLKHVLCGCRAALNRGFYTRRHDTVLKIVREALSLAVAKSKQCLAKPACLAQGVLKPAKDWLVLSDMDNRHYCYPKEIDNFTMQWPDLLIYSADKRQVVLVELTVPWEMNMSHHHALKTQKYKNLVADIEKRGFSLHFYAVEIGARGLVSKSFYHCLIDLGLKVEIVHKYMDRASRAAVESSKKILTGCK